MSDPVEVPGWEMVVTKEATIRDVNGKATVKLYLDGDGHVKVELLNRQGQRRGPIALVNLEAALQALKRS